MISIRRAEERGHADHGWLDTHHTFSFAEYHDLAHMGFGALRVINEDRVQPGAGFDTHSHRDMEIVSYVLEGELAHQDSMGNGSVIRAGEVQRMSAGTGVLHSERNPSHDTVAHFLQIWIVPDRRGGAPSYEQKAFSESERHARARVVASRDGRDGSLRIHQDALLSLVVLGRDERVRQPLAPGRRAWVQVVRGEVLLNGERLRAGDGAGMVEELAIDVAGAGDTPAEALVFDLA